MPIQIPSILGLPPGTDYSRNLIYNSMPIIKITPLTSDGEEPGVMSLNTRPAFSDWRSYLNSHDFDYKSNSSDNSIEIATLNDNAPQETFTNEYTESFLTRMTEGVSEGVGQFAQMMNARKGTNVALEMANFFANQEKPSMAKTAGEMVVGGIYDLKDFVSKLQSQEGYKAIAGNALQVVDALLAGGRVDLPKFWKNSSYSANYTFTVRLFNPYPRNDDAIEKYIIGPTAALLILGLPQTTTDFVFNWPYLHNISGGGMYYLNPCFISNITINKGIDGNGFTFNQIPNIVEVKLEFQSLYNTMILNENDNLRRPTLAGYLNSMRNKKTTLGKSYTPPMVDKSPDLNQGITSNSPVFIDNSKNTTPDVDIPENRVDPDKKEIANNLIAGT